MTNLYYENLEEHLNYLLEQVKEKDDDMILSLLKSIDEYINIDENKLKDFKDAK